jgi:tetrahydromethanopterin S-methyltransferase subunit B
MQMGVQSTANQSVVGVFDNEVDANAVLDQLRGLGLSADDVTVMQRDARPSEEVAPGRPGSPISGGAATGAIFGGLVGVLVGWMIAIGAIPIPGVSNGTPAIPGVGTVVPEGVLAAALTGLALGAATGALLGALLGARVPAGEPAVAEPQRREGRVLVTVHPSAAVTPEAVLEAMQSGGGYDVRVYDTPFGQPAVTRSALVGTPITTGAKREPITGEATPDTGAQEDLQAAATGDATPGTGAEGGYGDGEARELVEPQTSYFTGPSAVETAEGWQSPVERSPETGASVQEPSRSDKTED